VTSGEKKKGKKKGKREKEKEKEKEKSEHRGRRGQSTEVTEKRKRTGLKTRHYNTVTKVTA